LIAIEQPQRFQILRSEIASSIEALRSGWSTYTKKTIASQGKKNAISFPAWRKPPRDKASI
jgi:sRNA-binding carbon storage regulator CsrA